MIIRKAYWNYEKEEKWLNEMSAKGLALVGYTWCRYVFEDSQPGEYIYRIELLEYLPNHPLSQKYLRFMEENGVEFIASYMRWAYFRKKAADGAFDIYSDIDSKMKHYRRVNWLWTGVAICIFGIGLGNIIIGIGLLSLLNFISGGICIIMGIALILIGRPVRKRIRKLRKDKVVTEA